MNGRRKWAAIPGFIAIAALATALSAYSGARSQTAGGQPTQERTPPGTDRPVSAPSPTLEQPAGPAAAPVTGALQAPSTTTQVVANPDTNPARGPWGYSGASSDQNLSPVQPVKFPHPAHVQKAGMNCAYCHFAANKSPDPGMPSVNTCMGCHLVIKAQSPEIKKVAAYYQKGQPIPWVRIHKVPEYVHFPHMRHVNANVSCQTCHGEVQKMNQVFQYSSLNMGWCINCHLERKARYDCASCHY